MIYSIIGINILFALLVLILVAYLGFSVWTFHQTVPYVPTPYRIIKKMLKAAQLQDGQKAVDLGSGSGRIVLMAAKQFKGQVIGLEKSKLLILVSRLRSFFNWKKSKVIFLQTDIFNYDLSQFDAVFSFLTPGSLAQLEPNFQKLKPGSRLISYLFPLKNHCNFREEIINPVKKEKIFVYSRI